MEFTGERFLPAVGGEVRQEHLHRYAFAAALVQGKVVLDAACGEGYGCELLASTAAQVIGVDIDAQCVDHARAAYAHLHNLRLHRASVLSLPLKARSVDVVVSFETLEHLAEQEQMLAEFGRVLRPGGLLIISTPNRPVYSDGSQPPNEFHVKELSQDEFQALLARHFERHVLYGQRLATGSTLVPVPEEGKRPRRGRAAVHSHDAAGLSDGLASLPSPMYFVALATNAPALPRPAGSVLLSAVDDLYLDFRRTARWASGVDQEYRAAQSLWQAQERALQAELEQARQALLQRPTDEVLAQLQLSMGELQQQLEQAREAHGQALQAAQVQLDATQVQEEQERREKQHAQAALADMHLQLQAALKRLVQLADAVPAEQAQALRQTMLAAQASEAAVQKEWSQQRTQLAERLAAEQARMHQAATRQAALAAQAQGALEARLQEALTQQAQDRALLQQLQQHSRDRQEEQARLHDELLQQRAQERAQWLQQLSAEREARQSCETALQLELEDLQVRLAQAQHDASAYAQAQQAAERQAEQRQADLLEQTRQQLDQLRLEADARAQQHQARADAQIEQFRLQSTALAEAGLAQRVADEQRLHQERAALDALHARELSDWAQRSREWQDLALSLQSRLQAVQDQAAQDLDQQRASSRSDAEAAAQRERALHQLLQHRTQLATLLAREWLARPSSWADRLLAPRGAGKRWLQTPEQHRAELNLRQIAQATARLQWAESGDPIPEDVPLLYHASPQTMNLLPSSATTVQSLEDLLELAAQAFVTAAYHAVLGRAPDPDGLRHYQHALDTGRSRLQVLTDLRYSTEGRGRTPTLAGLEEAVRRQRLARIPVLGRLLPSAPRVVSLQGVRRDLNTLSGQMAQVDGSLQQRLESLERALQVGIQGLAQHAIQADTRIDNRLEQIEHTLGTAVQHQLQQLADATSSAQEQAASRLQATEDRLQQQALAEAARLAARVDQLEAGLQAASRALAEAQDLARQQHGIQVDHVAALAQGSRQQALQLAQAGGIARALSSCVWPEGTDLWAVAERWVAADGQGFVDDLFMRTLGRGPAAHENAHFQALMAQGASRWMVVDNVLGCAEFRHRQAPPSAAPIPPSPPAPVATSAAAPGDAAAEPLPVLPLHADPVVTVVIPVYGQLDYTLRCLRSIARNPPAVPFELIVVDDCSPDHTAQVMQDVVGVQLIRNDTNQGFIRSCNRGAAAARGQYLCLLNNDTEVAPGWLDELHGTFDLFPGTGYVGSKLLYPDGRLQEAGGILWQDGSAWNYGHGQNPELPEFNYVREVDYCSGASIMMPLGLFRRLGGLDEHYLPAYCEDSDIALKVRQAGLRVLYQPLSQVVHYEGVTSGTDTGSGVKAYQVVNTRKLFERWQARLSGYQPNGVQVDRAKDRAATRRVLVIDIVTPTADRDAGSVTVVNTLTLLREMRFQVTFIPEDNFWNMPEYTAALQRNGVEALYAPHLTSVEQHLQACGGRYDLVLLWRPTVVDKHLPSVRRHCPQAKVLFHTVDLHYLRMEREAHLLQDDQRLQAAGRMKALELHAVHSVDCAIVHSTHELEVLATEGPVDNVVVFPLIVDVPGSQVPFEARSGVAFVGGFQHVPNIDAVEYFVREVMPLIRGMLPGLRFHIIGSNATQQVLDLAGEDVVVEGFVPRLQPLLDRMRLSVAPLRYGAGIKGKVGNSMAMGLPVVASTVAVEGMQLEDGREVLIADGPQAMAEAVCRLHQDPALWARLQAGGLAKVERLSGSRAAYDNLRRLLQRLGLPVEPPTHRLRLYRDGY
jgi:GT2 family glycosyltransferase/SAM-dependent methyltransferase/glycosyltransferase involved in cell wall biosynthesis